MGKGKGSPYSGFILFQHINMYQSYQKNLKSSKNKALFKKASLALPRSVKLIIHVKILEENIILKLKIVIEI